MSSTLLPLLVASRTGALSPSTGLGLGDLLTGLVFSGLTLVDILPVVMQFIQSKKSVNFSDLRKFVIPAKLYRIHSLVLKMYISFSILTKKMQSLANNYNSIQVMVLHMFTCVECRLTV